MSSYHWQFQQMQQRAAASSCSTTAGTSSRPRCGSSVRSRRCARGSAAPKSCPVIEIDAPTTIVWEHENGIRGVWDITLAPDLYLRSDYYTNDERWEVTGRAGLRARQPLHRPRDPAAEPRGLRRRRDARVPRPRRRLGEQLPRLRSALAALAAHRRRPAVWSGEEAVDVLRFALAAYASNAAGGTGVDPASLGWLSGRRYGRAPMGTRSLRK